MRNQFRLHRAGQRRAGGGRHHTAAAGRTGCSAGSSRETVTRGASREKSGSTRLAPGDLPLNVEAAAFTPAGTLLLGLRFPVTDKGEPILVEIAGVEGMFDADARTWPRVVRRVRA